MYSRKSPIQGCAISFKLNIEMCYTPLSPLIRNIFSNDVFLSLSLSLCQCLLSQLILNIFINDIDPDICTLEPAIVTPLQFHYQKLFTTSVTMFLRLHYEHLFTSSLDKFYLHFHYMFINDVLLSFHSQSLFTASLTMFLHLQC